MVFEDIAFLFNIAICMSFLQFSTSFVGNDNLILHKVGFNAEIIVGLIVLYVLFDQGKHLI